MSPVTRDSTRVGPPAVGVDFGTTNSALAVCQQDGVPQLTTFEVETGHTSVFRSVLFFEEADEDSPSHVDISAGTDALERYVETAGDGRLMQSLKTFLASRHAIKTLVLNTTYELEQLIGYIVRQLRRHAEAQFGPLPSRVVAGRPVRFVHSRGPADDERAEARLRNAFGLAGFDEVVFELEPIAAARAYEANLERDERVLVADFGGGTSDFSLLRLGPSHRLSSSADRVIGVAGVGVAGDAIDARIVEQVLAPAFGKGTRYRSEMGRWMPVPGWVYSKLAHWHDLASLRSRKNMSSLLQIREWAEDPAPFDALIHLLEYELGFAMSSKVQEAKARLSDSASTAFEFVDQPIEIRHTLLRDDFESWIQREVAKIEECLEQLLQETGVQLQDVDRVFLTGGSSRVPRIARIFSERFPNRVAGENQLTSVAGGLALAAHQAFSR